MPGPKIFQMSWRMTQKRISRKTTLAKGDFRKSRGEGYGLPASLQPPPLNPHPLPFVRGLVMSTKKIRSIERSMTVKQYQHTPGNNKQHELFVVLYHSLKLITSRIQFWLNGTKYSIFIFTQRMKHCLC